MVCRHRAWNTCGKCPVHVSRRDEAGSDCDSRLSQALPIAHSGLSPSCQAVRLIIREARSHFASSCRRGPAGVAIAVCGASHRSTFRAVAEGRTPHPVLSQAVHPSPLVLRVVLDGSRMGMGPRAGAATPPRGPAQVGSPGQGLRPL